MREFDAARRGSALVCLWLLAALAGCGGGSGSSAPPPPTVRVLDDQYTVPAGAASVLAVSSNDSATGGAPTLVVATMPAHGKVTVQGTSLQYTPDAGYMGDDQFTYRADVGTATGTATVKLTVEAEIELSGTVTAINSSTEVTAQVGDSEFKATADASGAYKLAVKASKPNAFVTLTAKESGTRAAMTRVSLVGEIGSLIAQAGLRVNATQWPALTLDALSTARHGLLKQRGLQPTTTADLKLALVAQDPMDLLDIATLLRHVYEDGVALPSGAATATDLAANSVALGELNKQWRWGSVTYPADVERTLSQATATAAPSVPAEGSRLITMFQNSGNVQMPTGSMFAFRTDGSATGIVWTYLTNTVVNANWSASGDTLTITLASPLAIHDQYRVRAQQLRQLRGVDSQPSRQLMTRWLVDCQVSAPPPNQSCATPSYTAWVPVVSYDLERDRQALRLEDFAIGTRWGGLVLDQRASTTYCLCVEGGEPQPMDGTPNVPGFMGQLLEGRWLLTGLENSYRYTRLGIGQEAGVEYWLAELLENGVTTRANLRLVAKGGPVPALDTASMARRWVWGYPEANGSADAAGSRYADFHIRFLSDGRVVYVYLNGEVDEGRRWALSADKRSVMGIYSAGATPSVWYTPFRAVKGGYLAIMSGGGLIRMRDKGPAD